MNVISALISIQLKQQLIDEFDLRNKLKEKPIMRAQDEFECPKTLYTSSEMVFDMEMHRVGMALLMHLAGIINGNRPQALLNLKFKLIAVALFLDLEGEMLKFY